MKHQQISYELHTTVSVTLSIPSSVQREMAKTALIYSLAEDLTERGEAKG